MLRSPKPLGASYPAELRTLGDHVRRRRLALGLTQREAAGRIGVKETTVYNWESGGVSPGLPALPGVILFLGYNPLPGPEPGAALGARLRAGRRAKGLSMGALARELRVDSSTVADWERGRTVPRARYWPGIAGVLGDNLRDWHDDLSPAEQLRAARRRLGLTQRELGRRLGVAQQVVSRWERGAADIPASVEARIASLSATRRGGSKQ